MLIYEITVPGTWLDYEDTQWAWNVEQLISNLRYQFYSANVALNLFESARQDAIANPPTINQEQWERDRERQQELAREELAKLNPKDRREANFLADIRLKREKWQDGDLPSDLKRREKFLHAQTFITALDFFDKILRTLAKTENIPEPLKQLPAKFSESFPDLREVRNSNQHLEDRIRLLGTPVRGRPTPLVTQPVVNGLVNAPEGGVLITNSLNGTKFFCTLADGTCGEVDISPESMALLQDIFNDVLLSFKWCGQKDHWPK
jgi:hypothetical protein